MDSRLQSMSAEEFNKRLDAYKKTAKVSTTPKSQPL